MSHLLMSESPILTRLQARINKSNRDLQVSATNKDLLVSPNISRNGKKSKISHKKTEDFQDELLSNKNTPVVPTVRRSTRKNVAPQEEAKKTTSKEGTEAKASSTMVSKATNSKKASTRKGEKQSSVDPKQSEMVSSIASSLTAYEIFASNLQNDGSSGFNDVQLQKPKDPEESADSSKHIPNSDASFQDSKGSGFVALKDIFTCGKTPERYWELLAERRGVALGQALHGNDDQSVPQMPVSNHPVTQSLRQQSLPGAVSVAPSVGAPAPAADSVIRRLIQQQLVFLIHARNCQNRENQSNGEARQCSVPHCQTLKHVLSHMTTCQAGKSCGVPHCSSSRQILSHWKNCTLSDCRVCVPLKQACDPRNRQAAAAAVRTSQGSDKPTPADVQRAYAALGLPFNAGYGSANINPVIQQSQTVSVPPGVIPGYPSTAKYWHQFVTRDFRDNLVQKIMQVIFPAIDISALQDKRMIYLARMICLATYARKVEGDVYEVANSREEYYHLLAEKVYKIQKELEEKCRQSKELQMQ